MRPEGAEPGRERQGMAPGEQGMPLEERGMRLAERFSTSAGAVGLFDN
jgi:hypothetical protein